MAAKNGIDFANGTFIALKRLDKVYQIGVGSEDQRDKRFQPG
jgi:hypothetical protein